jgi:hypothetical protein
LNPLAGKIAEHFMLIFPTGLTDIGQQLCHGVYGAISHARNRSHAVTLNQHADDLRSFFNAQLVHAFSPI